MFLDFRKHYWGKVFDRDHPPADSGAYGLGKRQSCVCERERVDNETLQVESRFQRSRPGIQKNEKFVIMSVIMPVIISELGHQKSRPAVQVSSRCKK